MLLEGFLYTLGKGALSAFIAKGLSSAVATVIPSTIFLSGTLLGFPYSITTQTITNLLISQSVGYLIDKVLPYHAFFSAERKLDIISRPKLDFQPKSEDSKVFMQTILKRPQFACGYSNILKNNIYTDNILDSNILDGNIL